MTEHIERVRLFGGVFSHIACDPACRAFEGDRGVVPFKLVGRCAVAFGDPLAHVSAWDAVDHAFSAYCRAKGWVAVRVASKVPRRMSDEASLAFADLVFANPQHDPEAGHAGRHLRQNVNHVRRLGVTVREYAGTTTPDMDLEKRAYAMCERWRAAQRKPRMYLTAPRLFEDRIGRRWFVAEQKGDVIGMLSLLQAGNLTGGHLVNLVFAAPDAPTHTTDLLVCAALRQLRAEERTSICLGYAPRSALDAFEGFGRASVAAATRLYGACARFMHLDGVGAYWSKFGVTEREPLFIRLEPSRIGPRHLYALTRALNLA